MPDITLKLNHYQPGLRQPFHSHDHPNVSLLFRGGLRERARGDDIIVEGLALVAKPAGTSHADDFGPGGASLLQISLPAEIHDEPELRDGMSTWRWLPGGAAVRAALDLLREVSISGPASDASTACAAEVVALLNPHAARHTPPWLARVHEFLRDAVASGHHPRVSEAAAVAGVHPVYLVRVFQRHHQCTVSAWIRRLRVQRAALLLASNDSISRVAARSGFADQSHCNRSFKRETAMRPADYRALIRRPRLVRF